MKKIKSLSEIVKLTKKFRKEGKTVGLITGCFDVLHLGHIELFRFAKKQTDIVIVGLDNDESIKRTKGKNRPINNLKRRLDFLSDLINVDYVFPIKYRYKFSSSKAKTTQLHILRKIKPTHLITNKECDRYWKKKKNIADKCGILFLLDESKKVDSSGNIINKLEKEL